ncbi:N-acetyltransferase, partial [Mesorhizobium sp. M7A.F.Ca.CA.004.05.1.1]
MTIRYMNVPLAPDWMKIAKRFFARMITEGAIDAGREKLTGFEWGVFALEGTGQRSKPVGMAIYYQPEGHDLVWLDLLYVEPSHRGLGIATALIERTSAAAATMGAGRLDFGALCHNTRM